MQKSLENMCNGTIFLMTSSGIAFLQILRLIFLDNTSTQLILVLEKILNIIKQLLFCQEHQKE